MKNIVVKGLMVAGVAVGIAALSVGVQRVLANRNPESEPSEDTDDELDVIFKQRATEESEVADDDDSAAEEGSED